MAHAVLLYHLEAYRENFHDEKMAAKKESIDSDFASASLQKVVESIYSIER